LSAIRRCCCCKFYSNVRKTESIGSAASVNCDCMIAFPDNLMIMLFVTLCTSKGGAAVDSNIARHRMTLKAFEFFKLYVEL